MLGAYGWAYVKPIRKLYYNLNITLVSVLIAFLIGGIEVLSIIGDRFGLTGGIWDFVGGLDFGIIGFGIIAIFVAELAVSTLIYRWTRLRRPAGRGLREGPELGRRPPLPRALPCRVIPMVRLTPAS